MQRGSVSDTAGAAATMAGQTACSGMDAPSCGGAGHETVSSVCCRDTAVTAPGQSAERAGGAWCAISRCCSAAGPDSTSRQLSWQPTWRAGGGLHNGGGAEDTHAHLAHGRHARHVGAARPQAANGACLVGALRQAAGQRVQVVRRGGAHKLQQQRAKGPRGVPGRRRATRPRCRCAPPQCAPAAPLGSGLPGCRRRPRGPGGAGGRGQEGVVRGWVQGWPGGAGSLAVPWLQMHAGPAAPRRVPPTSQRSVSEVWLEPSTAGWPQARGATAEVRPSPSGPHRLRPASFSARTRNLRGSGRCAVAAPQHAMQVTPALR